MIKKLMTIFFAVTLLIGAYSTVKAETSSFSSWLKNISHKLNLSSSSTSKESKTAVAGIKGAEGEVSNDLYWKNVKLDAAERAAFDEAIKLAEEGKKEMALKKLEDFVAKYPKSPLIKDANEGIALLKKGK